MTASKPKSRSRWGSGRIAVIAKWSEIQAALAAGWPLTMIYEKHLTKDGISYSQFRRQVHRLQKSADARMTPTDDNTTPHATPQSGTDNVSSTPGKHRHTGTVDPVVMRKLVHGK
jgi:hypothetical protein